LAVIWRNIRRRTCSTRKAVSLLRDGAVGDRLQDRAQVADRQPLAQHAAHHAHQLAERHGPGDHVLDQLRRFLAEGGQQLLDLLAAHQLVDVAANDLAEVGGHHRGGIDHRHAARFGARPIGRT
jgi:hypothetical protein